MKNTLINVTQHIENTMAGTNLPGIKHRNFDFEHICYVNDDTTLKIRVVGYFLKFPTYNSYMHFDLFSDDYKMKISDSSIFEEDLCDIKDVIYKIMDREMYED